MRAPPHFRCNGPFHVAQSWATRLSLTLMTVMSLAACDGSPPDPGDVEVIEYPESRGTLLLNSELTTNGSLSWTVPTEVVLTAYSATAGTSFVRAASLTGGTRRTIDGPRPGIAQSSFLAASPNGAHLFFAAGAAATLYHKPSNGAAIQIAPSSRYSTRAGYSAFGTPLVVSPDSRLAAYVTGTDSVRVYDVTLQSSQPLSRGCTALLAFSPDGQELLCQLSGAMYVVTMANGQRRELTVPGIVKGRNLELARWTSTGLQVVYSDSLLRTDLVNAQTGASVRLLAAGALRPLEYPNFPTMTWSPDGAKAAFPTSLCLNTGCTNVQITIQTLNMSTGELKRAAVVNLTNNAGSVVSIGHVVFSPDGGLLAYLAGTTAQAGLYVVPVP